MLEFQQFQDKIRNELRARMKFSRDLLELRDKEAKLVSLDVNCFAEEGGQVAPCTATCTGCAA